MRDFTVGAAINFQYEGIKFLITVVNNFCECYAEYQYQFGNELIDMLVANYENGNVFIEY